MRLFFVGLNVIWMLGLPAAGNEPVIGAGLEELVAKVDEVNGTIETVHAKFTQRKEISLLQDPMVLAGDFYMKKGEIIVFDFDPEYDLELIINPTEMISLSRKAKTAERVKIPKRKTDLTHLLISENLDTILSYFSIRRVDHKQAEGGTELILEPVKRKLKKKIREVRIWVNDAYVIHRIKLKTPEGDTYELSLSDIQINPKLSDDLFQVEIPDDFQVGDRIEYFFGPNAGF